MSLLFETLLIKNSKIQNLKYHNERLNRSRADLFGATDAIDLSDVVDPKSATSRCKVIYDSSIQKVEYHPLRERTFRCFKIVESNISYRYKYLDRAALDSLYEMRGGCDDVIMAHNGKVLDTTIANIAYWDGDKWITPTKPLLAGTMRASLIDNGVIVEGDVRVEDILRAKKIAILNAIVGMHVVEDGEMIF